MNPPLRILVTGGAGFIGSHLCEKLLAEKHQVLNLDNFSAFYDPALKRKNIQSCLANPDYRLIEGDIRNPEFLEAVFEQHKPDCVIHLAAMAGVRPSIQEPLLYSSVNINGTQNLLEACRKFHISRFIFASSSSIYGNNPKVPFSETDPVDFPVSPYAATKKAGELLCYTYHHLYQISMLCLRFFTVYGPRQRPDLAIHKFAQLLYSDAPLPLYGDGSTSRDYTYIDDIISGICNALNYVCSNFTYEIINLGESKTISLLEMVKTLEKETGRNASYQWLPLPQGDVKITFADITKAKKLLQYKPQTEFSAGIRKFLFWFSQQNLYLEDI